MTEKDILNERFGELLLDSDAELDDSESVLDGVLTLDEDEESENEEEPDERIFDESGWSTIVENPEPFIMEATLETGDFDGYKPSDFFACFSVMTYLPKSARKPTDMDPASMKFSCIQIQMN